MYQESMNILIALASTDGSSTIGTLITGTLLFGFFVVITIFSAVLLGNFCSGFFNDTLPKWWKAVCGFFNVELIFGNEYDYPRRRPNDFRKAEPIRAPAPCTIHEFTKVKSEKYKWQMISGIPSGDSDLVDTIIERCKSAPLHSETQLQVIENWKEKGAVRIFTSINHYRCKKCWTTQVGEFYTMPIKSDGRPLVGVGLADTTYASKFKQTTRIATVAASTTNNTTTTSIRREVPVESLPYYCS